VAIDIRWIDLDQNRSKILPFW